MPIVTLFVVICHKEQFMDWWF